MPEECEGPSPVTTWGPRSPGRCSLGWLGWEEAWGLHPLPAGPRDSLGGPSQAKAVMEATGLQAHVSSSTTFSVFIHLFIEAFIEHLLYARPAEHSG